jgi:hypothetical protein
VVLSTDIADLVCFPLLFFAAVCHVRHGAATLEGPLRDVADASLSLPTVESETYSLTGVGGAACTSATLWTL